MQFLFSNVMSKQVLAGIIIGVVAIGLSAWFVSSTITSYKFIGEAEAVEIAKHHIRYQSPYDLTTEFVFLKYIGKQDAELKFTIYYADVNSKATSEKHVRIYFVESEEPSFETYLAQEIRDRYAWAVVIPGHKMDTRVFVDASSGELIGKWNPCVVCA